MEETEVLEVKIDPKLLLAHVPQFQIEAFASGKVRTHSCSEYGAEMEGTVARGGLGLTWAAGFRPGRAWLSSTCHH